MNNLVPWIFPQTIRKLRNFMLKNGKKVKIRRNELMDGGSKVSYLLSGSAMLCYSNQEGKLMGASLIFPGSSLGEFSLLTDSVRIFDIITLTRIEVMEVRTSIVRAELEADPEFKKELFDHIIARQYSAIIGFIYNNTYPIKYRLMALLMGLVKSCNEHVADGEWGEIPKVSQENLARIINTSRNTVNLLLIELVNEGLVSADNLTVKYDSNFIAKPSITFNMNGSVFNKHM